MGQAPRILRVESNNQWFQRVEALGRSRKKGHRYGEFVVEGVRSLNQLKVNPEWNIEACLYAPSRPPSAWAQDTLRSSRARLHLELSHPLMEELSDKDDVSLAGGGGNSIPMSGSASSLNVACVVTAILCEARRQRRAAS